ncbi:MAG TPA: penicillin-binding transpeptidase domain-containing protein [Acidobacteriaceae bacterium]|jgi:cell division protein FtsI/penicillin-binding protein 2
MQDVRNGFTSGAVRVLLGAAVLFGGGVHAGAAGAGEAAVARALRDALQGTQASAVVLNPETGAVLASVGEMRRGNPGSTVKPLLLAYALEHGIVRPEMEVYCRRNLHVGGRALPCTHPADLPVFTAESALAESCNTWFAEMGRRFTAPELEEALTETHLPHASMATANVEQRQLAVLGLAGVSATPLELANAFREMFLRMATNGVVARGLEDSVKFGMTNPAAVQGARILGKTGTASDAGQAWTHGWFAGEVPGRVLIVVYVPRGDGGSAARLAQRFFRVVAGEGRPR